MLRHLFLLTCLILSFRLLMDLPSSLSDVHIGEEFLATYIFVHLRKGVDKFNLLVFMCQKLYAVVDGLSTVDNEDTSQHHEVLLPGHLLSMFTKEKLQDLLLRCKEVSRARECAPGFVVIK